VAGDFLALTASIFFAAYLLTTEHVRGVLDTLSFSTLAIAGSVVTLLIVCLVLDAPLGGQSGTFYQRARTSQRRWEQSTLYCKVKGDILRWSSG
jgi:hypothetical protein